MPLSPIKRLWDHGTQLVPLESHVAKVLRDVGGYLLYREAYHGSEPVVSRVHWYESLGAYSWRLALREGETVAENWREVAQYPTFAESDAAARRHVRRHAVAVADGEEWCAFPAESATPMR